MNQRYECLMAFPGNRQINGMMSYGIPHLLGMGKLELPKYLLNLHEDCDTNIGRGDPAPTKYLGRQNGS